jgi:hypothetical protein
MQKQEILIEIGPDGQVEYRIQGVKGPACESISALLDQVGTVEKSERTAEYEEREPDRQEEINIGHE